MNVNEQSIKNTFPEIFVLLSFVNFFVGASFYNSNVVACMFLMSLSSMGLLLFAILTYKKWMLIKKKETNKLDRFFLFTGQWGSRVLRKTGRALYWFVGLFIYVGLIYLFSSFLGEVDTNTLLVIVILILTLKKQ